MIIKPHERSYIEARAEEEIKMAQAANNEPALQAHYDLANLYLELLYPTNANLGSDSSNTSALGAG